MLQQIISNRYQLLEQVGEGSYSVVFRGKDIETGREIAIKEMKSSGLTQEEIREAEEYFFREINILKKLFHESLPRVYDFFIFENRLYMVMEWVEGKNLQEIFEEQGKLTEEKAIDYMKQIGDALLYLQNEKRNIVYKDIKPSNIIINEFGRANLIDFGTARFFSKDKEKDTHVLGTPGYAPPEAYSGSQTDFSSDIYSLGATFYHLTTGEEPCQFRFKFPNPAKYNDKLSPAFSRILLKCLEPREKRIDNAKDLIDEMERMNQGDERTLISLRLLEVSLCLLATIVSIAYFGLKTFGASRYISYLVLCLIIPGFFLYHIYTGVLRGGKFNKKMGVFIPSVVIFMLLIAFMLVSMFLILPLISEQFRLLH